MCVNFCLQFMSFKFHAVSITRRFQYMPFPVSTYPPFPIHAVSSPIVLHAVSFIRAFHHYHCYTRIPLHTVSATRAFSVPVKNSSEAGSHGWYMNMSNYATKIQFERLIMNCYHCNSEVNADNYKNVNISQSSHQESLHIHILLQEPGA